MKKIITLIALLLLVACSPSFIENSQDLKGEVSPSISNAYPEPVDSNSASEPYPAPQQIVDVTTEEQEPPSPQNAPPPQPQKAAISGVLYSFTSKVVVPETLFYLTPTADNKFPPLLNGPDSVAGDIMGWSDKNGNIILDNVPPGNYFLVVWAPYNWSVGVIDKDEPETPLVISLVEGQQEVLGVIYLSWP